MTYPKGFAKGLGLVLATAMTLTACAAPPAAPSQKPAEAPKATEAPAAPAAAGGKLEVFSWWTSGGEAAALNALFDAYKKKYPGVEIVNATVAGGGGSAARGVLQTRLAGGDPPETMQTHPGWELFGQYLDPGYVEPVTDIYKEEGFDKVMPQGLIDSMTRNGEVYAVLAGVHRGNGFWYNKKLLEANGIKIGASLSEADFFAAADKLKAAGIPALCVGDSGIWATAELFENTLLGHIGADGWNKLFSGAMTFDDAKVKEAMTSYGKMLDYQNPDHASLSWDQAVKALMEGKCAFNSMGDWAYGEFAAAKKKDNEDFGWVSHPGTDGAFIIVADGFPVAKGAKNREAARNWLRVIGSKEAQEAFNPLKGSIPARTDVDRSKFGAYHNWSMDDFSKAKLVGTLVHGAAAPAAFQQAWNDAVTLFVVDKDVEKFSAALVKAAKDSQIAK
jgi:glucose/mannose transport system substrate-binding protein